MDALQRQAQLEMQNRMTDQFGQARATPPSSPALSLLPRPPSQQHHHTLGAIYSLLHGCPMSLRPPPPAGRVLSAGGAGGQAMRETFAHIKEVVLAVQKPQRADLAGLSQAHEARMRAEVRSRPARRPSRSLLPLLDRCLLVTPISLKSTFGVLLECRKKLMACPAQVLPFCDQRVASRPTDARFVLPDAPRAELFDAALGACHPADGERGTRLAQARPVPRRARLDGSPNTLRTQTLCEPPRARTQNVFRFAPPRPGAALAAAQGTRRRRGSRWRRRSRRWRPRCA
jgi:hypothetical protein